MANLRGAANRRSQRFGASAPRLCLAVSGHSSWSKCFTGQEEIRTKLLKPLFALFATEYRAHAINLVAEGDYVVAEVRGDVQTRAGKRYNNEYCFVFKFRGDKIAEVVEYCDTDLEERVLGNYDDVVRQMAAS